MIYRELKELIPVPHRVLADVVKAHYACSYGDGYIITDIRKAVQNRKYVFAKTQNGTNLLVVGENPGSLIVDDGNGITEIPEEKLIQILTGDVIIVEDGHKETGNSLVIFTPERDNWRNIAQKEKTIDYIEDLRIGEAYLPPTPVIVSFREPEEEQKQKKIRAEVAGVEIILYDDSDPLTEFFHELGHIYWRDVLTPEEKERFALYHQALRPDNIPPIYTSRWSFSDPEEAFCTIYLWFMKGKLLSRGYLQILKYHDKEGYDLLMCVIDRVEEELYRKNEFSRQAAEIAYSIEKARYKRYYIKGEKGNSDSGRVMKAYFKARQVRTKIPETAIRKVVKEENDLRYVLLDSPLLRGRIIPITPKNTIAYSKIN